MLDQHNRKINYLRLSVTDRCNLRCKYCMPESGVSKKMHKEILRHEEMLEIVRVGAKLGIEKVRLTGGEPLIRRDLTKLVSKINEIEGIKEVTLTTNGILLKEYLDDLVSAGISRINLSLDTMQADKYATITRGGDIQPVLDSIQMILDRELKLKINVVLIGGFNIDEIKDFINLTRQNPIDVRFIELMPIGEASAWTTDKFVSNKIIFEEAELHEVENSDISSPAKYYQLEDGLGKVGLINPISCSFCENCNRIRVTSDGKIKPCLHSDDELDLMTTLRCAGDIEEIMKKAILGKPLKHTLIDENHKPIERNMNRIGG